MPFENLAPWRTTPKPPCSSSGMGFHPGSLFVFRGMHTKREVAPPDTTCPLMVWKSRRAKNLPMCAVGTRAAAQSLHPAGTATAPQ